MRRLLIPLATAALLMGAAQPAAPPSYPVKLIKVGDLKSQLDGGAKIAIYDVRTADAYADMHIKDARNLPLREVDARAPKDVPKQGRVVLY